MPMTRLLAAAAGALAARTALGAIVGSPAATALHRTNFRGRRVTLAGGPALAAGATAAGAVSAALAGGPGLGVAAAVAGLGAGAVGCYDDLVGGRPAHAAKGFHGHLSALRQARVTSGLVKVVGVGAAGLAAAALLPGRPGRRPVRVADLLIDGLLIAGAANLANLFDLRPGRALKVGLMAGVPLAIGRPHRQLGAGHLAARHLAARHLGARHLGARHLGARHLGARHLAAGIVGAAVGLLPADLGEEIMLGDAGANALGALLGTAYAAGSGRGGRIAALAGIVTLTLISERVSFTKVIAGSPVLRALDELGRRGAGPPVGSDAR